MTSLASARRRRRRRKVMLTVPDVSPALNRAIKRAAEKQGITVSALLERTIRAAVRAERAERSRPRPVSPITPTGPAPTPDTAA